MSDTSVTDLSHYISDCTVSISPRWVIRLSLIYHTISLTVLYQYHQDEWYVCHWFITLYLWLYCINITKMSDTSVTDLSHYISDCTVSISPRWVIRLSLIYHTISLTVLYQYHQDGWYVCHWFITLYLWTYCINITKMGDTSVTDLSRYISERTVFITIWNISHLSLFCLFSLWCLKPIYFISRKRMRWFQLSLITKHCQGRT